MAPPVGQALEYLSTVLGQRGPQAVPYDEGVKWTIRQHMSELLKVRNELTARARRRAALRFAARCRRCAGAAPSAERPAASP